MLLRSVEAMGEDRWRQRQVQDGQRAGADLGALTQGADHLGEPAQQRVAVALLVQHVGPRAADRAARTQRMDEVGGIRPGKPRPRPWLPLHDGPHRVPAGLGEHVRHADLLAIADHRRPR